MHDSNVFENYFSASAVAEIERLIAGEREEANRPRGDQQQENGPAASSNPDPEENTMQREIRQGLSSAIADIENRFR